MIKTLGLPALLLIAVDQLTKYFIRANFLPGEGLPVTPFFNLVYATNTGVAFSMFQGANTFFMVFAIAAVAAFLVWYRRNAALIKGYTRIAVILILSGAIGNLIDRIFHGHVIDFLDVYAGAYHWPSFNMADSYISIGGVLLFLILFKPERKTVKN